MLHRRWTPPGNRKLAGDAAVWSDEFHGFDLGSSLRGDASHYNGTAVEMARAVLLGAERQVRTGFDKEFS
jgi:hypothetical protein